MNISDYKTGKYRGQRYKVAENVFTLWLQEHDEIWRELTSYDLFRTDKDATDNMFDLYVNRLADFPTDLPPYVEEAHQEEEGCEINVGRYGEFHSFEFVMMGILSCRLLTSADYKAGIAYTDQERSYGINNAMMLLYAFASSDRDTALFHSSVVSFQGKAYMFLGHSGMGKSTHSSLWLKYIPGTELVNDDNPVVRIIDGEAIVYGSPWSGKTPCYRNVRYPVGAMVRINQYPENRIQRLEGIPAYAALLPAISGMRWDKTISEGIHNTEAWLAQHVPIYYLDCLPDEGAAQLCNSTVAH